MNELKQLWNVLQKVLQISKAIDLDLDITFTKYLKIIDLLKQISVFLQTDYIALAKEITASPKDFFSKLIHDVILPDFNPETEEYGALSLKILKLFQEALKSEKPVHEIQLLELLEVVDNIFLKIEQKLGEAFLGEPGTIPPGNQESLSTTETESKTSQKKEKKV